MCVIIIKQKEQMMSREVAKTSARINPHGLGIIWLDTFEVEYHKSKDYRKLLTKRPFIAHFRYATKGKINRANTHPFVCGNNKDEYLPSNEEDVLLIYDDNSISGLSAQLRNAQFSPTQIETYKQKHALEAQGKLKGPTISKNKKAKTLSLQAK